MQIAKVIPKVKTSGDGIFDYSIPPEILPQIKCGVLVEVPFHGRNIEAVVIDIKRSSKINILKPIAKVIDPQPVIDDARLELAKWMSDYYLAPLGQTLFENIVPPAKRTIKKTELVNTKHLPIVQSANTKKFLVLADFDRRLKFYLMAIDKTLKRKQSVLILIPDLKLLNKILPSLKDPIVLHANLTKTERWLAWNMARQKSPAIVIGSQSALFAPVNNLGLIIIDEIENSAFKNDRSPRFSVITTAEKLAEISKTNLVFGSSTADLVSYFHAKKHFKIFQHNLNKPQVDIVDVANSKGIISETLKDKIQQTLVQNGKILLVYNRKGEGSIFSCLDCGWIYNCTKCDLPLRPSKNDTYCQRCEKHYPLPVKCPKCSSLNLKSKGLGTKKVAQIIKSLWPEAKVVNFEKDGDNAKSQFDIAITTSYGLRLDLPKINFVAILDADSYMNLPDYRSIEDAFITYYKFLELSKNGLIQTAYPNDHFAKNLAGLDYENFFNAELSVRKEQSFPPYVKIINLTFQNAVESISKEKAEDFAKKLEQYKNENTDILGPNPFFIYKKLNKYRWQIIIKLKGNLDHNLRELIKNQRDLIVDVDPIDLI